MSIMKSCSQSRPNLLNDLLYHIRKLNSNQITFIWIQSYIDMTGNDRADTLAQEALIFDHVISTNSLEFEEMFTVIQMCYSK